MNVPPTNKIILEANGWVLEKYLKFFFSTFVSSKYNYRETSGYRSPEENAKTPGAAADSTHMYNLGKDWILIYQNDGTIVPESEAKREFEQFKKKWKGYIYFDPSTKDKTYHIHSNIDRDITKYTKFFAVSVGVAGVGIIAKSFMDSFKKEKT